MPLIRPMQSYDQSENVPAKSSEACQNKENGQYILIEVGYRRVYSGSGTGTPPRVANRAIPS